MSLKKRKNQESKKLNLQGAKRLPEVLDLSKYDFVDLSEADFAGVREVKWPKRVKLYAAKNLPQFLDLSKCVSADLSCCDFATVQQFNGPSENICLFCVANLPKTLDLSKYDFVDMACAELNDDTEIILPKNVRLDKALIRSKVLDFSKSENVSLIKAKLIAVSEIKCPSEKIDLTEAFCPNTKELTFSGGKNVILSRMYLPHVEKIKSSSKYIKFDSVCTDNALKVVDLSETNTAVFQRTLFLNHYFFGPSGSSLLADSNTERKDFMIKWPFERLVFDECFFKIAPELDFASTKQVYVSRTNLGVLERIKWPSDKVVLRRTDICSREPLDLSKTKVGIIDVLRADLNGAKWPTERFELKNSLCPADLDLSGTNVACLSSLSLKPVQNFRTPKEEIYVKDVQDLPADLDLSDMKKVVLSNTKMKNGFWDVKWPTQKADVIVDKSVGEPLYSSYLLYKDSLQQNEAMNKTNKLKKMKQCLQKFITGRNGR